MRSSECQHWIPGWFQPLWTKLMSTDQPFGNTRQILKKHVWNHQPSYETRLLNRADLHITIHYPIQFDIQSLSGQQFTMTPQLPVTTRNAEPPTKKSQDHRSSTCAHELASLVRVISSRKSVPWEIQLWRTSNFSMLPSIDAKCNKLDGKYNKFRFTVKHVSFWRAGIRQFYHRWKVAGGRLCFGKDGASEPKRTELSFPPVNPPGNHEHVYRFATLFQVLSEVLILGERDDWPSVLTVLVMSSYHPNSLCSLAVSGQFSHFGKVAGRCRAWWNVLLGSCGSVISPDTLALWTNLAMDNPAVVAGFPWFPLKKRWFSISMLDYRSVPAVSPMKSGYRWSPIVRQVSPERLHSLAPSPANSTPRT